MSTGTVEDAIRRAGPETVAAFIFEPVGGSPREFADYVKTEITKWGKVVREGNIKAE